MADRSQSGFVKLALADAQDPFLEVDVGQGEGQCLAKAKPCAVKEKQERSVCIRINRTARMVDQDDGIESSRE